MPKRELDPKDRKANPTGLRPARSKKRWEHVDRVGDFDPDRIPSKRDTAVLRDDEKAAGVTKLDRATRFEKGRGVIVAAPVDAEPGFPVKPGGGKGRAERP